MYFYCIYGLKVASEILFPEAVSIPEEEPADVEIVFGESLIDIMEHPDAQNKEGIWQWCLPEQGRAYFRCDGMDFAVTDGARIVVSTNGRTYNEDSMRTYLLGTAMGAVHIQRGNVPIHGAAVEGHDGVTIITGFSGAGKSAILGALAPMGYRYLADDVAIVEMHNGVPTVLPAYPQRKIAEETAIELGYDTNKYEKINEDGRYKYVVRSAEEWRDTPQKLAALVEVVAAERTDGAEFEPQIEEIKGHASLGLVIRNLYRRQFYNETGVEPERMKKLLMITSGIRCARMVRPKEGYPVMQTARIIADGYIAAARLV